MENYGSEIGQKMRCAVKAKLLELGTGGSSGYIDDELPDYVMIMVANKRSKQQMISDLNLFLGSQTELFVTWLHEVLQKLQEVTLPAVSASSSKKRKSSVKEDSSSAITTKKEKKPLKKEKVQGKKSKDVPANSPEKNTNKSSSTIRDFFADELLEKAKQDINTSAELSQNIKKSKQKSNTEESDENHSPEKDNESEDFDIPTISEISSTTEAIGAQKMPKVHVEISGNREKDLAELAEIQKKIYAAKKQLKQIGELEDDDDEYDEDFISIRDDESREAFSESRGKSPTTPPVQPQAQKKAKSPIVFDKNDKEKAISDDENSVHNVGRRFTPPMVAATSDFRGNSSSKDGSAERPKRPVHERLGLKALAVEPNKTSQHTSRDRRRNVEKELYVPAFRRKEMEKDRDLSRERDRGNLRDRVRDRKRESDRRLDRSREHESVNTSNVSRGRSRVRKSIEDREKRRTPSDQKTEVRSISQVGKISTTTLSSSSPEYSPDRSQSRKRIGSRVIVAPTKVLVPSDEDEVADKPVNSIIKIKPRTPVSPSKQAPKNLLLRAVAEAQKSTFIKSLNANNSKPKISARLGDKILPERSTKLYTKSFRDRRKTTGAGVGAIFTRTAQNLIVEVNGRSKERYAARQDLDVEDEDEEEYVPEIVSDRGESDPDLVYVPQTIKQRSQRDQDEDEENWTTDSGGSCYEHIDLVEPDENQEADQNTQFVVTLNDEKSFPKLKRIGGKRFSPSLSPASPPPQVSSSSSYCKDRDKYAEATSTSSAVITSGRRSNSTKDRTSAKDLESSPTIMEGRGTPTSRSDLADVYRKNKEVKKIIIQNDSEDEEMSPTKKQTPDKDHRVKRTTQNDNKKDEKNSKSTTPPLKASSRPHKESVTPSKRKHAPIKFDLDETKRQNSPVPAKRRRSLSKEKEKETSSKDRNSRERDRDKSHERREERRKISIRNSEIKKYDNLPSTLSSVPVDSAAYRAANKPKERCKYHPNCTKTFCEFYHPTATCKSFPNCKYAEKCLYSHPKCKYDLACVNLDCNFSHSGPRSASLLEPAAPPLSSSVVPVQNYKSISSSAITGPVSTTTCKFFPNCTKTSCPFYHPKPCRYGKNCINKLECLFYHHENLSSNKFKWVASIN